ncbi:hypothetical protein ACQKKK_24515 [Peribacillus sp. NPDC006672]|uniref:hypothetical protein n=1 Tax=Peribacillus sp. NPDC006672 TaxID=3390606 RepID=UPI003D03B425
MNSFFKKTLSLFFEKAERRVKPLMYAQSTVFVGVVIAWFLGRNNINNWSYSAIMYLMLGTGVLLIGIENFIVREKKSKDYLIWFISALLFYWIAIDYYFFN